MEEITFAFRMSKTKGSTLESLIREHLLAKKLLNNSTLFLYLTI